MSAKPVKHGIIAAVLATSSLFALGAAPASAATFPLCSARLVQHFDLAKGQTPESIVLAPNGTAYVAFAKARQIAEISPSGAIRILATLPAPADGGVDTPALGFPLTVGIDRATDGTLYFLYATGTADLTGVWRLRPGGTPQRIAPLPATSLPNGLALDQRTRSLYVADSTGVVWRVPAKGGTATVWSSAEELAPAGFLGANGIKLRDGAAWVTNLDRGTIVRIPLHANGNAGSAQVTATGLTGIDDFAFTGGGNEIIAALDTTNQVALVKPDGTHTVVLTAADGLQGPTAIAVRGRTVYVPSAAYLTAEDPNLLQAHLGR
ncbi:SMP-30/gluconolactonase/LRE family protein [Amycolatopsis sp. lyj-109]|uniref:SMP-30/gluconolactonase/LRE family protein n=1 Tax=Amycolatopsis sp. lyj-109 TaxID=2789287 RepID=UPI0039785B07